MIRDDYVIWDFEAALERFWMNKLNKFKHERLI